MRFPLEIFTALREAWPREKPIGAKISGTDFAPGGWTVESAASLALLDASPLLEEERSACMAALIAE